MTLAIIPARGGSKRVPQKNYRELSGVPTICRTIRILQRSQIFKRIIVSTDHADIEKLALSVGAEVPFRRPDELSDDHSTTKQVVQHAIRELGITDPGTPVCCVYPTAVLVRPESLRTSLELLHRDPPKFVVPVQSYRHPISRAMLIRGATLEPVDPETARTRTQDCDDFVHDAGQFYWGTVSTWLSEINILGAHSVPFKISPSEGIDVDTTDDWTLLEALIHYQEASNDSAK